MRACWHCTQLIHDEATVCRFCKESVPQMHSIEERQNFTNKFQQLSTRSPWDLKQTLGSGERRYAQKVVGMEAPERFGISLPQQESQVVHAAIDPVGAQLRRLLNGHLLLGFISMAFVTSGLVFQMVEVPSLASQNLIIPAPTSPQDPNRGLVTVYQNVSPSAVGVGDAALDHLNRGFPQSARIFNDRVRRVDPVNKDFKSKDGELRTLGAKQKETDQGRTADPRKPRVFTAEDSGGKTPPTGTSREAKLHYVYAKNGVNIRKRPNGAIVRRAEAGEKLELLGRERNWNKVRLPDGTEAFIHESVVTDSDTTRISLNLEPWNQQRQGPEVQLVPALDLHVQLNTLPPHAQVASNQPQRPTQ